MTDSVRNSQDTVEHVKPPKWRHRILWLATTWLVIVVVASAYWRHGEGEGWLSAFGLSFDRDYLQFMAEFAGNFIVPVLVTILMMQTIMKLSPSREKTTLAWIGWSFFVFLFVWWSPLHTVLFGPG